LATGSSLSDEAVVLDASAVLAFLFEEQGASVVERSLPQASISTANWGEVWQRVLERQAESPEGVRERLVEAGLGLEPLSGADAEHAARLRAKTRERGLSLADRCAIALAARLKRPVLTTDRAWAAVEVGVEIRLIRGAAGST
jgi:PIN domain nuclease of toxin-antitoxin system